MNSKLIIAIVVLFAVAVGFAAYLSQKHKEPKPPSVSTEKVDTSNWQVYRNEEWGFLFKYPPSWGDVSVKATPFVYSSEEKELFYSHIDLDRVLTERYTLFFTNKPCDMRGWCNIGFQIRIFNSNTPLDITCYEGICNAINLVEDRTFLQKNYNTFIDEYKGYCKEDYFKPGANVSKHCRTYNGDMKLELQMGYGIENPQGIQIDYDNFSFEQVYDRLEDKGDFDNFLNNYKKVLDSITFLNTQ